MNVLLVYYQIKDDVYSFIYNEQVAHHAGISSQNASPFLNSTYPNRHHHPLNFENPLTRSNSYKLSYRSYAEGIAEVM